MYVVFGLVAVLSAASLLFSIWNLRDETRRFRESLLALSRGAEDKRRHV